MHFLTGLFTSPVLILVLSAAVIAAPSVDAPELPGEQKGSADGKPGQGSEEPECE